MVKKNLTIKIPKPKYEIEKIIVKPYRPPSEIKKIIVKPQIPPPVDSNFTNLKI
jgi:hypothetical protein